MRAVDLIIKKRNGDSLSKAEIDFLIEGYVKGEIPDYQMSAFLMATYFSDMTKEERLNLTIAMLKSGEEIDLSLIKGIKCDKHSTGGVGDKTSLVVAPLAAACGIKMAKMSGRGLGHTGGTLDKLESIPGFKIEISADDFYKQVNDIGLAIIGQTANITPADKLLYALRDVTGTVESIPLIASSIMSKKLASGADNIVLDVKVGEGAFMKDVDSATKLAAAMVEIGNLAGRRTVATLTDMSEPLGNAVGNAVEVMEAIETLKGHGPKDFTDLCINLTAEILIVSNLVDNLEDAIRMTKQVLNNGEGLNKFADMIKYQHGNADVINNYALFPQALKQIDLVYKEDSTQFVSKINALSIGEAAMLLGAGRTVKSDSIDYAVGVVLNKKIGDVVNKGDVIATIYTNHKNTEQAMNKIYEAYQFTSDEVKPINKIIKVVR